MMWIKNLKIGIRLSAGFGIMLLFLVIIAGIGVQQMDLLIGQIRYISDVDEAKMKALHKVQFAIGLRGVAARNIVMLSEEGVAASDLELVKTSQKDIDDGLQELHRLIDKQQDRSDAAQKMLAQLQAMEKQYLAIATRIVNMAVKGQGRDARLALVNECMPLLRKVIVHIGDFGEFLERGSQQERAIATDQQAGAKQNLIIISGVALILGYLLARLTRRSITGPLKAAVSVAQRVSQGDLTGRIVVESKDEVGQLMTALQEMNGNLQRMVKDIHTGTSTLTHLSGTISDGNRDLSSRTEEQAGSLEETAAAMEELTQTVRVNTDNARQANTLVESTSGIAMKGSDVVQHVVKTMSAINESSEQIVSIISVIDGIAFQTNILALNAAVEAARAGEQGRGFAVVASEVRSLAQRSSTAAKEIKALIDDSVLRVKKGSELVNEAGSTMEEILTSIKRVRALMTDITSASSEQSSGIEQVNNAIVQIDKVTQQNAELVVQAATAADSMQEQTQALSNIITLFKLS